MNNGSSLGNQVDLSHALPGAVNSDWQNTNITSYAVPPTNPPAPSFTSAGVVNAASGAAGPISAGEILVIYGSNLGPAQLVTGQANSGRFREDSVQYARFVRRRSRSDPVCVEQPGICSRAVLPLLEGLYQRASGI